MRKRSLLCVVIAVIVAFAAITSMTYLMSLRLYLKDEAVSLSGLLDTATTTFGSPSSLQAFSDQLSMKLGEGFRVTLIDRSGTILADSGTGSGQGGVHADLPEVTGAFKNGYGQDLRPYGGINYLYSAKKLSNNVVVVLSKQVKADRVFFPALFALILSGLAAVLAVIFISKLYGRAMKLALKDVGGTLEGVTSGSYTPLALSGADGVSDLVGRINELSLKAVRRVRESEAKQKRLEYLLENMREGFVVLDSQADVLLINRAAKEIFSIPHNIGRRDRNILLLVRNVTLYNAVRGCIEKGEPSIVEISFPGDSERIIQAFINPIGAAVSDEYEKGAVVLLADVTQIKKLERMRSEFTANVSHEMKTPLTSIRGFADMLCSGMVESDPHEARRFLKIIIDETDRLTNLINDVLELSELETSGTGKRLEPVRLDEVAQNALAELQKKADEKNVSVKLDTKPVTVMADCWRMMEVFVNLIDNAIKYNRQGGSVTVKVDKNEDSAIISVSDTGIGVAKEHIPRLTERFYRVDKGRSRTLGSTGLGLSIVKHILELYGGSLSIESEYGRGTTVTAVMPLKDKQRQGKGERT